MKKLICLLLAAVMVLAMSACSKKEEKKPEGSSAEASQEESKEESQEESKEESKEEPKEESKEESKEEEPAEPAQWSREGIFEDAEGNMLSVIHSDMEEYEGWFVGLALGEDSYNGVIQQEGDSLHGNIAEEGEFIVTVSEEGEGLRLEVEGGETYSFPNKLSDAGWEDTGITLQINTEGLGWVSYAEEGEEVVFDEEYPAQSLWVKLPEPGTYVIAAKPDEGWVFVKWTKDGEDLSTEPTVTVEIAEDTELIAVFDMEGAEAEGIDYMALVNKLNPLPEGWEEALETVTMTNSVGDEVEVEAKAYDAYLALKADLEAEGIFVDLDSARRSVETQQEIMDRFIEEYGEDYAKKTVATPGYSEHHTGLALDLYLIIDGKDVVENEDMIQYPEIWAKIHEKLANYGFILRYLEDKEHITGYGYEPWHIRYIDDPDKAGEIMSQGLTLEEYLGAVNVSDLTVELAASEKFSEEELKEAAIQIKCDFASWKGCELKSLRYAGDDAVTEEKLEWLNSLEEGTDYKEAVLFLGDFHTPEEVEDGFTWDPDTDYTDYQWWLVLTEEDGWQIVSKGY